MIERVCLTGNITNGNEYTDTFIPRKSTDLTAYVDAMLLRLEREFPMPRPPIWAGQCWSLPGVAEGRSFFLTTTSNDAEEKPWVGALLYGPTKYGRDVPWLHPSLLPG